MALACDDGSVRLFTVEGGVPGAQYQRTLAQVSSSYSFVSCLLVLTATRLLLCQAMKLIAAGLRRLMAGWALQSQCNNPTIDPFDRRSRAAC